jgi:hypothetical protein
MAGGIYPIAALVQAASRWWSTVLPQQQHTFRNLPFPQASARTKTIQMQFKQSCTSALKQNGKQVQVPNDGQATE